MGGSIGFHDTCVIIMLLSITGVFSDSVCKRNRWKYDDDNSRCLMVSQYPLTYDDAIKTCDVRLRRGRLITPTTNEDMEALVNVLGPKLQALSLWAEFVFEKREGEIMMFDGNGAQLDIKACGQCLPLAKQVNQEYQLNKPRTCSRIYNNPSIHWNLTDCEDKHYAICQFVVEAGEEGLSAGDIAAIAIGSFIFLCFIVTLIIDIYIHLRREKRKYFENNLTAKTGNEVKTLSTTMDAQKVNFG